MEHLSDDQKESVLDARKYDTYQKILRGNKYIPQWMRENIIDYLRLVGSNREIDHYIEIMKEPAAPRMNSIRRELLELLDRDYLPLRALFSPGDPYPVSARRELFRRIQKQDRSVIMKSGAVLSMLRERPKDKSSSWSREARKNSSRDWKRICRVPGSM
jgi:hypothetical protein